jgi:hypothetical protein
LNGDNQFNDRPAYATAASTDTMQPAYGKFDLDPATNAQRIPYDAGTGPTQFSMNLRVAKTFGIGPRASACSGGAASSGGPGGQGGGGLGPGGLSGSGGPPKLDQAAARRYSLTISAMSHNVFHHVSLAAPDGVLESPLFGKSTAIAGGFFGSAAANRRFEMQATFSF